ncbi:Thioesterase/thiol ester dehydrase-isomerase [Tilletiaria anomala UBC 951]|uniref:Thioesterase/thiol ester dehydrase-isomerase n=1 Tax=Tilletiaria anomala (strain ATCC 24038 / CBS 436.72 / UBC 951) TaxID=1037660 RepID=A0A066W984_TILAU|nr:Thioesterase/thiol ester dehydrase-isomerase [Tilletiaria anomala UBC 951]KDN47315.1 Thioesterase/thiol ester dehydrase-isomerase [Tilletiaria anomala UBC 951]
MIASQGHSAAVARLAVTAGALLFSLAAFKASAAIVSHYVLGTEMCNANVDTKVVLDPRSAGKPVSSSIVQVTYTTTPSMCFSVPSSTDPRPAVLSGPLLKMIDIVASVAARRHAGVSCVTISVDAVLFLKPIYLGELIHLSAAVNRAWGSSMEVGVKLTKEEPERNGKMTYVSHSYLTFVAVQTSGYSHGSPSSTVVPKKHPLKFRLPPVLPETALELRRYRLAGRRRARRMESAKHSKGVGEEPVGKNGIRRRVMDKVRAEVIDMSSKIVKNERSSSRTAERQRIALDELELEYIARAYAAQEEGVTINPSAGQIIVEIADDEAFSRSIEDVMRAGIRIGVDPACFERSGVDANSHKRAESLGSDGGSRRRRSATVSLMSEAILSPSSGTDATIPEEAERSTSAELGSAQPLEPSISAAQTLTRSLHLVFPEHCNSNGVLFGGQLMGWMEEVALMACRSLGHGQRFSTVALDGLEFKKEVQVGEIIFFTAVAVRAFANSVEVYVVAEAETREGKKRIANEALFTAACAPTSVAHVGKQSDQPLLKVVMPPGSALESLQQAADGRRYERLAMKNMLTRLYAFDGEST